MSDPELGKLIDGDGRRDAIHVAIAPVVAAEWLEPGERVGILPNGTATKRMRHLGVVDPFLPDSVAPGRRFYMVLFPRSITSLRHEWTHPAFDSPPPPRPSKEESEAWLREFCKTADCPRYEDTIAAAAGRPISVINEDYWPSPYRNDGEYLTFHGRDAHGDIPPEFWDHVENVTGVPIPLEMRASSFSCSC